MSGKVQPISPSAPPPAVAGSGNGNRKGLGSRVAVLEAHLNYLATKEDIQRLETLMAQREAVLLRWLIGIIAVAAISLVVALIRPLL